MRPPRCTVRGRGDGCAAAVAAVVVSNASTAGSTHGNAIRDIGPSFRAARLASFTRVPRELSRWTGLGLPIFAAPALPSNLADGLL
jgi:hypothetical protein